MDIYFFIDGMEYYRGSRILYLNKSFNPATMLASYAIERMQKCILFEIECSKKTNETLNDPTREQERRDFAKQLQNMAIESQNFMKK